MNHSRPSRNGATTEPRQADDLLEQSFAQLQDELLGMLFYLVGNAEDARDALQESFLKCWRHRHNVNQIENLRAWIFRVALNVGRDLRSTAWRRRSRPMTDNQAMLSSNHPAPEDEASRHEQLTLLRRAVADLRPEEQEVFLLRQDGLMTYDQIARTINIPLGTVKTRMRLALTKLREALESKIA